MPVKVIPFAYPVYCPSCDWKGKRTWLNMIKPCPRCGHHPVYIRRKDNHAHPTHQK